MKRRTDASTSESDFLPTESLTLHAVNAFPAKTSSICSRVRPRAVSKKNDEQVRGSGKKKKSKVVLMSIFFENWERRDEKKKRRRERTFWEHEKYVDRHCEAERPKDKVRFPPGKGK